MFAVVKDGAWDGRLVNCRVGRTADGIVRAAGKMTDGAAKTGIGAGPRREAAHTVVDDRGRFGPVDQAVFFFQEGRSSGAGVVLRLGPKSAIAKSTQGFGHERSAELGEAL